MIPKIIHYIWLGGKPKPPLVNICILSWREKLPDYQIIEWNESNLDLDKIARENRFFAECRKRHMWAFMADYLRLKILYQYGGIYMDTDMQVCKSLEPLLDQSFFVGNEDLLGTISCGIIGASGSHPLIARLMNFYDQEIWKEFVWTIPSIITKVIEEGKDTEGLSVFPPEYFYPYPFRTVFQPDCITERTYTIHWWAGSWAERLGPYLFLCTKQIHNPIKRFFVKQKKIAGFYYRKWRER